MKLEELSYIAGIMGAIAGLGSLYYAWRNDKLWRIMPKDPQVTELIKNGEESPNFISKLQTILKKRIDSRKKLKMALNAAKTMHFAKPMDAALIEINKRALELGDIKFAYKVATNAHFAVALDEMLMNVVEKH